MLLASLSITTGYAQAVGKLQGNLWLVPSTNLTGAFPPPSGVPDVTFAPKHISFLSNAPGSSLDVNAPHVNNSVSGFLNSADKVSRLAFSGAHNAAVGAVVQASTPIINTTDGGSGTTTYGAYMELTGKVMLTAHEFITITHDDGVSLMIDGELISGPGSGPTNPVADGVVFAGKTGTHSFDLVHANSCGSGILSFSPVM